MKYKVFIDGRVGTTGLKIDEYLAKRNDIEVLGIDEENRKNPEARLAKMAESDLTFLCLPDSSAKEIAEMAPKNTRIIDASTVHRTLDDWVYGMPELSQNQRHLIKEANRVANPGCHATGFILMLRPLIDEGILPKDYPIAASSITGFSGGGKQMISEYAEHEAGGSGLLEAPRQYALTQNHKHLPEMQAMTGLDYLPAFSPNVSNFYSGMSVLVHLHTRMLNKGASAADVRRTLEDRYAGEKFVRVRAEGYNPEEGFLSALAYSGRNDLEIFILGNEDRILLTSRYDNLGKGASGAAIQSMNLMLGIGEEEGLL
jgi:N-acetyl-gamma-glutamyl-phosphate reductase